NDPQRNKTKGSRNSLPLVCALGLAPAPMVPRNSGKTPLPLRTLNPAGPARHDSDGRRPPTTLWLTGEEWVWVPFEVDRRYEGFRVDRFLAQRLTAYSRARVQTMLNHSRVMRLPTGQAVLPAGRQGADQRLKPSAKVHGGDKILIAYPRQPEPPLPPDISLPVLY